LLGQRGSGLPTRGKVPAPDRHPQRRLGKAVPFPLLKTAARPL